MANLCTVPGILALAMTSVLAAGPAAPAPPAAPDDDIARGRPYTLVPPPNYGTPTHAGDATNLTDGAYVGARIVPGSVVWNGKAAVRVDIDLGGSPAAIGEIFFQVLDRPRGGVFCPRRVVFEVSDDGVAYHKVRELHRPDDCDIPNAVCSLRGGKESGKGGPEFQANYIVTSGPLQTRGSHVRLSIEPSQFLSIDEVEVRPGTDAALTNYLPEVDYEKTLQALGPDWRVFPEGPWEDLNARSLPAAAAQDAVEIRFALAGGETGAAALRLTNPRDASVAMRTEVSPLQGPGDARLPATAIKVRQGIDVATALFEPRADALVSLARTPLRLDAKSVGHLFLEASVPSRQPQGTYRGTLHLTGGDTSKSIPIVLDVRPFTLTPRRDLAYKFFDWSYAIPENSPYVPGRYADERAALRADYGENAEVNYLTPSPTWKGKTIQTPDFRTLADDLKRQSYSGLHLFFLNGVAPDILHFRGNACYPGKSWNTAYAFWMQSIRAFMDAQKIPPDRYALFLMDESRTGTSLPCFGKDCSICKETDRDQFDFVRDAASIAHQAGLRVFLNPLEWGKVEGNGLQSLVGKVDIWSPPAAYSFWKELCMDPSQFSGMGQFYEGRKAAGETLFTYSMGPDISQSSSPALAGRRVAWRMFHDRLAGYGYWAMYAMRKNGTGLTSLWDPFDEPAGGDPAIHDYGTVYLTRRDDPKAPEGLPEDEPIIPSRRLAALRQGIEDYRYLDFLRQLIDARKDGDSAVSRARETLNAAVDEALKNPDDPASFDRARDQVAAAIEALLREPAPK
jgi:hypothetical protein